MSLTVAALFADTRRNPDLDAQGRRSAKGEGIIWLILAATGLVSILVSFTRYGPFAAFAYSTLPLSIGLFARRYDWTGVGLLSSGGSAADSGDGSASEGGSS